MPTESPASARDQPGQAAGNLGTLRRGDGFSEGSARFRNSAVQIAGKRAAFLRSLTTTVTGFGLGLDFLGLG